MFFKSKEEKLNERLEKEERISAINKMLVSTLPTCDKPYEVIGIVTSGMDNASLPFSSFMDEIKKEAYHLGADAIIGITFQTASVTDSYQAYFDADSNSTNNHFYTEVKSRAVGTAIKYK